MTYIFTIHSPITLLAAVGTMVYEKLPTENVVLICGGQFNPPMRPEFKGKIVKSYDRLEAEFSLLEKIKAFNYTDSVTRYIEQLSKDDFFTAYIDVMSVFNRYLVRHPKCQQFHVIEEGIVNYADYDDFMLWTADLRHFDWQWNGFGSIQQKCNAIVRLLRGRSLRLLAMPIHPNLYTLHQGVNAYCFSDVAFQYTAAAKKKLLSWDNLTSWIATHEVAYEDNAWFWIGDTLCKSYGVSMVHYERALQELLTKINPDKNELPIFLKFRGGESENEKKLTLQYLEAYNFRVISVPHTEIMEMVFLHYKNLKVCGIASSLLIYAHLMGHQTHSLYAYIPDVYGISIAKSYQTIAKKVGFLL